MVSAHRAPASGAKLLSHPASGLSYGWVDGYSAHLQKRTNPTHVFLAPIQSLESSSFPPMANLLSAKCFTRECAFA